MILCGSASRQSLNWTCIVKELHSYFGTEKNWENKKELGTPAKINIMCFSLKFKCQCWLCKFLNCNTFEAFCLYMRTSSFGTKTNSSMHNFSFFLVCFQVITMTIILSFVLVLPNLHHIVKSLTRYNTTISCRGLSVRSQSDFTFLLRWGSLNDRSVLPVLSIIAFFFLFCLIFNHISESFSFVSDNRKGK